MRFFFIVQGEGRGHMTQAISLSQILRDAGHEIIHVVVGKSPQRKIPQFFFDNIKSKVTLLENPNFATDKNHKSVKPLKTLFVSIPKLPNYIRSIKKLSILVKETKPDVIINFYDFLGGIYNLFYKKQAQFVCIAHQYLIDHSEFTFPKGRKLDRFSLKLGNKITSFGVDKILALSFQPFEDQLDKKMYVVPPLLRDEVKKLTPTNKDHILAYMVNPGYGIEIDEFHQRRPDVSLEVFWDQRDKPTTWKVDETLTYNQLDDKKFLEKMSSAKGYVTTAGFESVCEAMYLGKPVMMVPVEGHYEQACNAIDAEKAGAGIWYDKFEIERLVDYLPSHESVQSWFKDWADSNKEFFIKHLS